MVDNKSGDTRSHSRANLDVSDLQEYTIYPEPQSDSNESFIIDGDDDNKKKKKA